MTDMAKEAGEDAGPVAQTSDGAEETIPEVVEVREAPIAQFDVLEIVPEILDWIELRRVAGQAFEVEARLR